MKLLTLVWLSMHGYQIVFSGDQCRALRQASINISECTRFGTARSIAASYGRQASSADSDQAGTAPSAGGRPASGPGAGADAGGRPSGPSGPASGGGSPGGSPGNPGGGAGGNNGGVRPGEPIPTPPPSKPAVSLEDIAKLRSEIRDAVRDRIIHGAKPPPSRPQRPGLIDPKPPDTGNGKPPAGFNPGPGGMRGQATPKSSGGAAWGGQAR